MNKAWGQSKINQDLPLLIAWNTGESNWDATNLDRAGVFSIKNKENGKVFVGHAHSIIRRYELMAYLLNENKFGSICKEFQEDYNYYGATVFDFKFHEFVLQPKSLWNRSEHWRRFYLRLLQDENKLYQINRVKLSELKRLLRKGD